MSTQIELFGIKGGIYDGKRVKEDYPGILERAKGGTVLIDDIHNMPWEIQTILLSALETKNPFIRRVGDTDNLPVNARFIFVQRFRTKWTDLVLRIRDTFC